MFSKIGHGRYLVGRITFVINGDQALPGANLPHLRPVAADLSTGSQFGR